NLTPPADDGDPDAPFRVDCHPVGHSFGEPREELAVIDRPIRTHCVGPHSMRSRITMVEELPIWTEAQPVGDLDAFPQFRHLPRRINAEERPRRRCALEIEFLNIAAKRATPDTALVIGREAVQAAERFSLPLSEKVAHLARLLIPVGEG